MCGCVCVCVSVYAFGGWMAGVDITWLCSADIMRKKGKKAAGSLWCVTNLNVSPTEPHENTVVSLSLWLHNHNEYIDIIYLYSSLNIYFPLCMFILCLESQDLHLLLLHNIIILFPLNKTQLNPTVGVKSPLFMPMEHFCSSAVFHLNLSVAGHLDLPFFEGGSQSPCHIFAFRPSAVSILPISGSSSPLNTDRATKYHLRCEN